MAPLYYSKWTLLKVFWSIDWKFQQSFQIEWKFFFANFRGRRLQLRPRSVERRLPLPGVGLLQGFRPDWFHHRQLLKLCIQNLPQLLRHRETATRTRDWPAEPYSGNDSQCDNVVSHFRVRGDLSTVRSLPLPAWLAPNCNTTPGFGSRLLLGNLCRHSIRRASFVEICCKNCEEEQRRIILLRVRNVI